MDIVTRIYNETLFISHSFSHYFQHVNYGFLDIETTGLNSSLNKVFLVGLMTVEEESMTMTQFFADSEKEEKEILEKVAKALSRLDVIITYNGSSFDIPFLNKRFAFHNIQYAIPGHASFDLYRIIKRNRYPSLSDYKLKTVENYMGIQRKDTLSGKECILLYHDYVKNNTLSYKKNILLHNREDIYYLSRILPILNKYNLHKIIFDSGWWIHKNIILTESKISHPAIILKGLCYLLQSDYSGFSTGYNFTFDYATKSFILTLPFYEEGNFYYLNLLEFPMSYTQKNPHSSLEEDILLLGSKEDMDYLELNGFIEKLIHYICYHIKL